MIPAFQAAVIRLEGQRQNLFWRIHRNRRSAAIDMDGSPWKPLLRSFPKFRCLPDLLIGPGDLIPVP